MEIKSVPANHWLFLQARYNKTVLSKKKGYILFFLVGLIQISLVVRLSRTFNRVCARIAFYRFNNISKSDNINNDSTRPDTQARTRNIPDHFTNGIIIIIITSIIRIISKVIKPLFLTTHTLIKILVHLGTYWTSTHLFARRHTCTIVVYFAIITIIITIVVFKFWHIILHIPT